MFRVLRKLGSPALRSHAAAPQRTLRRPVALRGIGVHTGLPAKLTLNPAPADTGLVFAHLGLAQLIAANWRNAGDTTLRTTLCRADGGTIATVEHLLAACAGLELDNLRISIEGPEIPAFDGSAAALVDAIDAVGLVELAKPGQWLKVLKPIRVQSGRSFAEFLPAEAGLTLDVEIDFPEPVIGRQRKILTIDPGTFRRELARARSFGFLRDLGPLQARSLALGASLDNTVALLDDAVLNPEGLRFPDECVRHKMLDALGDLRLAGAPITGVFRSYRGGHALNVAALRELFADPANFAFERTPSQHQCTV
jgi:UDP-3-O-[3-hydroxymyristoyl] N-acetylglucosamine deacetylase